MSIYLCGECGYEHGPDSSYYLKHIHLAVTPVTRAWGIIAIILVLVGGFLMGYLTNEYRHQHRKQVSFNALPDYVQPVSFAREWDKENRI